MRFETGPRIIFLTVLTLSISGCSPIVVPPLPNDGPSNLSGKVHGGEQPVSNSTIQLYAVGTGGDRSAATPLLTKSVTTDQNGAFNITSDYTCPTTNPMVYLVATGGNPGLASGTNNQGIALMAGLGPCNKLTASTFIFVNELTTVGTIAALYPYTGSYASIGSGSSDLSQLNAAFTTVAEYVDTTAGTVPGPTLYSNQYASSTEIDTLGDILSTCVNSAGGTANDGSSCGALFSLSRTVTGVAPTDTIGAVLNILNNPTVNVSALFRLVPAVGAPFQPSLTLAPSDWTLPISPAPTTPSFQPGPGAYFYTQKVYLTNLTADSTFHYTVDGSTPTVASPVYNGSISVAQSETIQAIAVLNGRSPGPLASASYTINQAVASMTATNGNGQSTVPETVFPSPLRATLLDASKNPVVGIGIFFTAPSSGASASLSRSTCTTDATGSCSITATANQVAGTYAVAAGYGTFRVNYNLTNSASTTLPSPPAPQSYVVTVTSDATTGVAANCPDQNAAHGTNSNCSLRDALAAAALTASNAVPATITFAQATASTITLVNGTLNIPSYTTIQGATTGSGSTLTNLITVDGNHATSVFTEAAKVAQAVINNLIITHGNATGGLGGGVYTSGALSVSNSTFAGNTSSSSGGAISNNGGTLTVSNSTFAGNTASQAYGGAIDNFSAGIATISNSTFNGNTSAVYGGAIYSSGTVNITDSTIVGNTSAYGGGVYNLSAVMTVTNSIVNGNSYEDCGGVYCATSWVYVNFSSATPTPVDSASITVSFSDSLKNTFSQTFQYGPSSSPASVASAFGPYFYENFSGLDTTPITGKSFGSLLVISPENGATLSPLTIVNPGKSFAATQTIYPFLLSGNKNIYGVTSTQVNLSPLGNYGGPTQTMVPLAGSAAVCVISPSSETGTDQRGQPRSVSVGMTTCQDAGAVQTSN